MYVELSIDGVQFGLAEEEWEFSNSDDWRLECEYPGDEMAIDFSSRVLTEMLSNLESDQVNLEMSAPNRAGIILPADGLEEGEDILMLVMPVMINS